MPKKFLNLTPTPKIAPNGLKSAKKVPNLAELKQKDRAVLPKPKFIVYINRSQ